MAKMSANIDITLLLH